VLSSKNQATKRKELIDFLDEDELKVAMLRRKHQSRRQELNTNNDGLASHKKLQHELE